MTECEVRPQSALAVGRRVAQIAVRNVIPVRVSPRPRRAGRLVQCRVIQRTREVGRKPTQRRLDRGPAVAKHVVGGTQPRVQIIEIWRVPYRRKIARGHERAGRHVLFRNGPVKVVVPHAEVQRQLPDRPLILREEAEVPRATQSLEWYGPDRDRLGRRAPERVRPGAVDLVRVVGFVRFAFAVLVEVESCLEGMRAGDVGDGEPLMVLPVMLFPVTSGMRQRQSARAVSEVCCKIRDLNSVRSDALFPSGGIVEHVRRRARLNQQPARGAIRPRDERQVVEQVIVSPHGLGSRENAAVRLRFEQRPETTAIGLRLIGAHDLMLRAGLPRQSETVVPVVIVGIGRPTQIGLVQQDAPLGVGVDRRGELVVVVALLILLVDRPPVPREEPQRIAHDRTAKHARRVIRLFDRGRKAKAPVAQSAIHIVALQARAGQPAEDASRERVASVFGHDVHLDAAGISFGRHAARLDHDFLKREIVEDEDGAPLQPLTHAVLQRHVVNRATPMNPELRALVEAADTVGARLVQHGTRDHRRILTDTSGRRERIQRGTRQRRLLSNVAGVHHRGGARDGDGFLERSHPQLRIHCRREPRRQLEAFSLDHAEARQREGDGVDAGPQIDDPIQTLAVSDDGAGSVDECGTGGFHRDAAQHRTRRISYDTSHNGGVGNLCPRCRGDEKQPDDEDGTHESLDVHGLASDQIPELLPPRSTAVKNIPRFCRMPS